MQSEMSNTNMLDASVPDYIHAIPDMTDAYQMRLAL